MPFLAGQIITADKLNNLQPKLYEITASGNQAVTATEVDVAGMSITLDSLTANAQYEVIGVFSFDSTGASTANSEGRMQLDGVQIVGSARWSSTATTDFGMATQVWEGTLGAAGTHTFTGRVIGEAGVTSRLLGAFTRMTVKIFEVV